MTRPQLSISAALALVLAPACGDDTGATNPADAASNVNVTDEDPEGGLTEGESESLGTTTAEPAPFVPVPAVGGIELEWVEANQGIGVAIGRDGAGVGG